jgi:hypothetical protein
LLLLLRVTAWPTIDCSSGLDLRTRGFAKCTRTIHGSSSTVKRLFSDHRLFGKLESVDANGPSHELAACRRETRTHGKPMTDRGGMFGNTKTIVELYPAAA